MEGGLGVEDVEKTRDRNEGRHREEPSMGLFLLSVLVIYASTSHQLLCDARDRLAAGESISVNQTVVSVGEIFALGFFAPGNSSARRYYAGIWYNGVPERTVVWVANRAAPLIDPAGVLTVTGDGNVAVLDGTGGVVWSTNLSGVPSNTSAVLLDSGNLVLRDGDGDVWQSFDHPTDTLLPRMRLTSDFSTGEGLRLTSWKGAADPSPGGFLYTLDPKTSLQLYIMKGPEIYWRGTVWNGTMYIVTQVGNLSSVYIQTVDADDRGIFWTYTMTDTSQLARYVLDHTGSFSFFYYDGRLQRWIPTGTLPTRPCDFYNRCGPSGSCEYITGICRCLEGFEPRSPGDWEAGNFTGGCVRRVPPRCDGTDGFVKFSGMKLPDGFSVLWNRSAARCEGECSSRCGCQAYAYTNFTTLNRTGTRCLIWLGEMTDLARIPVFYEDLYVRLHDSEVDNNNNTTNLDSGSSSNKNKVLIKIIVPVLSAGILLTGIFCCSFMRRFKSQVRKKTRKVLRLEDFNFSDALGSERDISDVPLFDFKSVRAATSNFSLSNKLGEGGFGPVFKGKLLSGHEIAVKRLSKVSNQGYEELANEVKLIANLQHKNLVRLLGWCTHKDEKMLIYEYMPNRSLDMLIFDKVETTELNWEKRLIIIEGIANGLLYLHQYSRMRIIHRDMKTSNILLDVEMNPKISDFGLARILEVNQTEVNTGRVVGTYGYMAPEYALDGVFSEKSDVFSFGVIVLEIITGKRSTGYYPYKNSLNLLGYAWQMWEEGRALELQDPLMGDSVRVHEVLRCIQLGLLCIQEDAADRPTISSVVSMLNNENSTMPTPSQPAFAIGRNPRPIILFSRERESKASTSRVSRSSVESGS